MNRNESKNAIVCMLMKLLFAALVEALGMSGEVEKAVAMVQDMECRGVIESAGVYYALASALCTAGRLSEALVQVRTTSPINLLNSFKTVLKVIFKRQ